MKKNMLLIHGWDFELYSNMTISNDAWSDYKELIKMLEKKYNLYKINFPGFCKQDEPNDKEWNVNDFSNYVNKYINDNNIKVDVVLGYSFGGAVAIRWKVLTKSSAKLLLVAPAIIRDANNSKKFINTPKVFDKIRKILRDLYVIHIIKNNEMKYGTSFLKKSYQLIVREDMRSDLNKIDSNDVCIIYGLKDKAVAPQVLYDSVDREYKKSIYMIENAYHDDIITEYIDEIEEIIDCKVNAN